MYIVRKFGVDTYSYGRFYYGKYGSCISMTKDICKATLFHTVEEATNFISAYLKKCKTVKAEEV